MNKRGDATAAKSAYERAFALDPTDSRVLFELDQLDKRLGRAPAERLARLEGQSDLVDTRDDLTIERVLLLNVVGRPADALALLTKRTFHPWEGGEGKVAAQYTASHVALAKQALLAGDTASAIQYLAETLTYPLNLGEGKLAGTPDNQIYYLLGVAYRLSGDSGRANAAFEKATLGSLEPTSQTYYNDQPPEMIFYQGMARRALGRVEEADAIFRSLVNYGRDHMDDAVQMDYFAVSLPDFLVFDTDLEARNRLHCHFIIGLGWLGLGSLAEAQREFDAVLAEQPDHLGAVVHRGWRESLDRSTSSSIHA